jgi:hypothetical protein
MGKFNPGDRVRYENVLHYNERISGTGVVVKCNGNIATIRSDYGFTVQAWIIAHDNDEIVELESVELPVEDYHARKFDGGKADWTLLPAAAALEIFAAHSAAYNGQLDNAEPTSLFTDPCAAAEMLMLWRAGEGRKWLAKSLLGLDTSALLKLGLAVDVLGYGAKKYARDSWRLVPDAIDRYFSAAIRHLEAMADGETYDEESGLEHLGHLTANIVFLLELTRDGAEK